MTLMHYRPAPGAHLAVIGDRAVLLVAAGAATPTALELWRAASTADPVSALLGALSKDGFAATPDFALLEFLGDQSRLVLRGAITATVAAAGGDSETWEAGPVTTWTERLVAAPAGIELRLSAGVGAAEAELLPLVQGVVRADSVLWTSSGQPALPMPAAAPATPAPVRGEESPAKPASAHAAAEARPASRGKGRGAAATNAPAAVPAVVPVADPVGEASSAEEPGAERPAPGLPPAPPPPPPAPEPISAPVSEDTVFPVHTIRPLPASASPVDGPAPSAPPAPVPAPPADPAPAVAAAASGDEGDDSYDYLFGQTVVRTVQDAAAAESASEESAAPSPEPAAEEAAGDHDGETVLSSSVSAMRAKRSKKAPVEAARFSIELSTGGSAELDGPVIVGRMPSGSAIGGQLPQLITIAGAKDISRSHVQFTIEGDSVVVTDLNSRNGTVVAAPGKSPQQLRRGEPTVVLGDSVVDLGGGITLTVKEH